MYYIFVSYVGVVAEKEDKRFVFDSAGNMEIEVAFLTNEVLELKKKLSSEIARQQNLTNTKVARLQTEMNNEVIRLQNEMNSRGSTYVRWGKESCNTNGTTLIYKGYMAGKAYNNKGSGTNSLCLPADPTWGKYDDANQDTWRGYIYGAEYQVDQDVYMGKHTNDEDIPCAVCKVPGTSVMIPARVNCYPGWKLEYTGYLMSGRGGHYSTNYVCMDGDPEFVFRGAASTDGHLLYLVEGICGTLPCPPYFNYRELACVVCSM